MVQCPICSKSFTNKADILTHVDKIHKDEVPEDMSIAQYVYMLNHNGRKNGICRYCGKETPWNEKAGKPYQICGSPECKEKNKKIAEERMLKIYGKTNLLDDPKQQEKMLANRSISGTYNWSDGKHKFTYTGTYEKFAIEWLDKVMDLDPETIQMPGPILPYDLGGETHYWITDMYLTEFNLIIEVKDGMENKHPGYEYNRQKEAAKDKMMYHQNEFNYLKLTHKNMMQLVKVLTDIRNQNITSDENKKVPVIAINESAMNEAIKYIDDKGNKVPKECPKCGSKVGIFLRGEPVFLCTNKKCNKYFGTVPFNESAVSYDLMKPSEEQEAEPVKKEKPLGKKRVVIENDIKKVKMLPNEASGHKDQRDIINKMIEEKPDHIWCLSDVHIGRSIPNMTLTDENVFKILVDKINSSVDPDDMIFMLGDIVTSSDDVYTTEYTKKLLSSINCKNVVLVLGNNDNLTVKEYYDLGYMYVTDRIITEKYLFSHCPEPVTITKYNIHGHIHGADRVYNMNASNHIDVYYYPNNGENAKLLTLRQYVLLYIQGNFRYINSMRHEYRK